MSPPIPITKASEKGTPSSPYLYTNQVIFRPYTGRIDIPGPTSMILENSVLL